MEPLKSLDAEFLHLEDRVSHMHIASACMFDGVPPDYEQIVALIAGKLHEIPQYRQRVRPVPFELGRPVWVDDPFFDLRYHVRHTALPVPGDDAMFTRLMGRLMSQPLDRDRPLWEVWLVEGFADGHWALVCKVHHSMVDGIAGVQLLTALLDITPDARPSEPRQWSPRPEPSGVSKVLDAWSGLAADGMASLRRVASVLGRPRATVDAARTAVSGLGAILGSLGTTAGPSTGQAISPHRSWAHACASLDDVKVIGRTLGGTVNDVILAAVAGSFRRLLEDTGVDPATALVRSAVPVSTRGPGIDGVADNRVSVILYELPVALADPVERLAAVRAEMAERKETRMAEVGQAVVTLGDLLPPMVVGPVSRLTMRVMRAVPQRSVDTITTNVPGPQFPLYCLGRELLELWPFVPIAPGISRSTAIMSYNGRLFFGVSGDFDDREDVERLAAGTVLAIDELHRRALIGG